MHACAIVNPAAGQGRVGTVWPELRSRLQKATTALTVCKTSGPGDATTLTRAAVTEDYDRIVAVGGDGTLHEVVNGYFQPDGTAITSVPPLVPLACGTGTDFNRALGGKSGLDAVSYLHSDRVQPVDLLRLQYTDLEGRRAHRYAINVASLGLSGDVVRSVNRGGVHLPGPRLRYLGAIVRALFAHAPVEVTLTLDNEALGTRSVRLVAIANGHTFGAGIKIAPDARIDDGLLNVTLVHDVSPLSLLRSASRFYKGTHLSLDGVTTHEGRRLTVQPVDDAPVWLEADGELLGKIPVTVEVVPAAIQLQY